MATEREWTTIPIPVDVRDRLDEQRDDDETWGELLCRLSYDSEASSSSGDYTDPEVLRHLYWEEDLTVHEIAARFDCSHSTILNHMEANDIERRDPHGRDGDRPHTDPDVLRDLYWGEELSISQVAERLDVSSATIQTYLAEYDIERRDPNNAADAGGPHTDPDRLETLYWEEGLSLSEIGAKFDVSPATIREHMEHHDIERRDRIEAVPKAGGKHTDPDVLRDLYWGEGLSLSEVAEELDVSPRTIHTKMQQFEIPRREPPTGPWDELSLDDELFEHRNYLPPVQRDDFEALVDGTSARERAAARGVDATTVRQNARNAYERLLRLQKELA